jgi:hypothetical protein
MTSPYVATVLRPMTRRAVVRRQSFLASSQRYFRGEHARFLLLELLIFLALAALSLWPMLDAVSLIQSYLL